MNVMIILGAAIVFIGIYLIAQAVKMKKSNEIIGSAILAEEEAKKCKNKEGFITYMYGREVITGVALLIMGAAVVVKELVENAEIISNVVIIVMLLVVLWFFNCLREARSAYLN